MTGMRRRVLVIATVATFAAAAATLAFVLSGDEAAPPLDDTLPDGAVARIGTIAFRPAWSAACFAADGTIVRGAPDGFVRMFDAGTDREVRRIEVHGDATETPLLERIRGTDPDGVCGFAVSPDGRFVATTTAHVLRITDLSTGTRIAEWTTDDRDCRVAWNPDGGGGTVASHRGAWQWSLQPRAPLVLLARYTASRLRLFGPVTRVLAVRGTAASGAKGCLLVDSVTRAAAALADDATFRGAVAAPDGAWYAAIHGTPCVVTVYDAAMVETASFPAPEACCWPLATTPDGAHFLLAGHDDVVVLRRDGTVEARIPASHTSNVAFSPDGRHAALSGHGVVIVETATWTRIGAESSRLRDSGFGVRPGDHALVVANGNSIATFDRATGRALGPARVVLPSPCDHWIEPWGRLAAVASPADWRFEDARTGEVRARATKDRLWIFGARDDGVVRLFERDGVLRVAAGGREAADVADLKGTFVLAAALSADGRRAVVGMRVGMRLLDVDAPTASRLVLPDRSAFDVAISADGSRAAAAWYDGSVRVHDGATGAAVFERRLGAPSGAVGLSPDGLRVAFAVPRSRRIDVFDVASGELVRSFPGHSAHATELRFTPDGRHLVSAAAAEGTLLVWDLGAAAPR